MNDANNIKLYTIKQIIGKEVEKFVKLQVMMLITC